MESGLDLVGEDLGVGLGAERVARFRELRLALGEVLEDAVVHDDDLPGAVGLGMRVQLRRASVRGPARVPDPGRAGGGRAVELLDEVAELAGRAVDREPAVRQGRDARRVVAAVFEPLQPLEEERARLTGTDVADDAAHGLRPGPKGGAEPERGPGPVNCHGTENSNSSVALRRVAQPSLFTCGDRDSARAPSGTSSVTVVPAPT